MQCQWKHVTPLLYFIAVWNRNVFKWAFLLHINTKYSVKSKANWHLLPEIMHLKVVFLFCSQAKLQKLHQAPLWIVISVIPQLLEWIRFRLWLTQFTILNIWFLQTQSPELTASGKNMAINIYYSPRNCILHYFHLKINVFLFSCLFVCIITINCACETGSIIINIVFLFYLHGLFIFLAHHLHLFDLIHLRQTFVSIYYVSKNAFLLLVLFTHHTRFYSHLVLTELI